MTMGVLAFMPVMQESTYVKMYYFPIMKVFLPSLVQDPAPPRLRKPYPNFLQPRHCFGEFVILAVFIILGVLVILAIFVILVILSFWSSWMFWSYWVFRSFGGVWSFGGVLVIWGA
jgi:hypothetical protein